MVPVIEADPRWYLAERSDTVSWHVVCVPGGRPSRPTLRAARVHRAGPIEGPHGVGGDAARVRPRPYSCLEVPDVFEIDGRGYLTALTGTVYGNARNAIGDLRVTQGTIFAVSELLDGVLEEGPDNPLIGSPLFDATSCRSVMIDGVRYAFYFRAERGGATDAGRPTLGVLGTPKLVVDDTSGRVVLKAAPQAEGLFATRAAVGIPEVAASDLVMETGRWHLSDGRLDVDCPEGWSLCCAPPVLGSMDLRVTIRLTSGAAAGVLFHAQPYVAHPAPRGDQSSLLVLLDAELEALVLTRLRDFGTITSRSISIRRDADIELRGVVIGEFIEVYLDGVLILDTVRYELREGMVGLFAERGRHPLVGCDRPPSDEPRRPPRHCDAPSCQGPLTAGLMSSRQARRFRSVASHRSIPRIGNSSQ